MSREFKGCRKCYNSSITGFIQTEIGGETILSECECHILWREKEFIEYKSKRANLPSNYGFNNYKGEQSLSEVNKLKNYIKNYKNIQDQSKSLYFYGDNGTQKTSVASTVGHSLLELDISVFYVSTMDSIISTLSIFENQQTKKHKDFINNLERSDLLIIDECFANKKAYSVSDYQLNILRTFLKNRLEVNKKDIIFISNILPEQIEEQGYTKTLQSLVQRNTHSRVLTFKDYYYIDNTEFQLDSIFT